MSDEPTERPQLDLDAIKARADAATPGPWTAGGAFTHPWEVHIAAHLPFVELAHTTQGGADAAFVAHTREDVPTLVAELERLRDAEDRVHRAFADADVEGVDLNAMTVAELTAFVMAAINGGDPR